MYGKNERPLTIYGARQVLIVRRSSAANDTNRQQLRALAEKCDGPEASDPFGYHKLADFSFSFNRSVPLK